MLWVRIPPAVDIKFLSCARSSNLHSPFGKISTDFWWQGVLHIDLGLKILVYVLCWLVIDSDCICARFEADIRRARHKQYTHTHRHRIILEIVKHRIDFMVYTFIFTKFVLTTEFHPNRRYDDLQNFRLNFLYSDVTWKRFNLYNNFRIRVYSNKKKRENIWYSNVHHCYL